MASRKRIRILYVAPAETLPGRVGGSVHVEEVSRGLAALGYDVDVLIRRIDGFPEEENLCRGVRLHRLVPKYPLKSMLWRSKKYAFDLAESIKTDYIIERYYNFGGAGIFAGKRFGIPVMLEVNSPAVDHPGSLKAMIDWLLLFRPMKRYREFLCREAADIIAPLPSIVPPSVQSGKIHKVDWGAAVDRFKNIPSRTAARKQLGIPHDADVVVFLGSFRKWHGVWDLAKTAEEIIEKHPDVPVFFLMIGGGPEQAALEKWVRDKGFGGRFKFTGGVEYSKVPALLAAADIGVAPYNPSLHGQLKLGFYWSPLKIFEYMAAKLPVVTIDVEPLNDIIRNGREGMLYPPGDAAACAEKILKLLKMPASERRKTGRNAFERVSARYSWKKHCEDLDRIIRKRLKIK